MGKIQELISKSDSLKSKLTLTQSVRIRASLMRSIKKLDSLIADLGGR